jgi:hypothetical protein
MPGPPASLAPLEAPPLLEPLPVFEPPPLEEPLEDAPPEPPVGAPLEDAPPLEPVVPLLLPLGPPSPSSPPGSPKPVLGALLHAKSAALARVRIQDFGFTSEISTTL